MLKPVGSHHVIAGVQGELRPASVYDAHAAVPFHMLAGLRLAKDLAAGKLITYEKLHPPRQSRLWALRRELERLFLR